MPGSRKTDKKSYWLAANLVGTLTEAFVTHPLETMRLRHINGTAIYRNLSSLYAGIHVRIIGTIPMRLSFWETHRILKEYDNVFLSAAAPGIVQSVIDAPLNHWKTNQAEYGRLDMRIRGTAALVARNTVFSICYFPLLTYFQPHWGNFTASAMAAMIAAVPSQPFEVIRVQKQSILRESPYINILTTLTDNYRNPANLWRGLHHRTFIAALALGVN